MASRKFSQIKIKADYNTATVGIDSFTLITNIREAQIEDAKAIMRAKVILPLAMQKHDAALFDSVLAKNFILKGGMNFSREKLLYEIALKGNG